MGIRVDIQDELKKETVTKIHGQPTSHDLTILKKELIAILASIPTALGGRNFGHVGVIMDMTTGISFADPAIPGGYPAGLTANAAATIRARAEAEHKELINQFETLEGVRQGVKDLILEAVDNEYLIEIEHEMLGYLNQTPRQMLGHLLTRGGALNFTDTKELLTKRDGEWNIARILNFTSTEWKKR
jgi:hypothetical protein